MKALGRFYRRKNPRFPFWSPSQARISNYEAPAVGAGHVDHHGDPVHHAPDTSHLPREVAAALHGAARQPREGTFRVVSVNGGERAAVAGVENHITQELTPRAHHGHTTVSGESNSGGRTRRTGCHAPIFLLVNATRQARPYCGNCAQRVDTAPGEPRTPRRPVRLSSPQPARRASDRRPTPRLRHIRRAATQQAGRCPAPGLWAVQGTGGEPKSEPP